MAWLNLNWFMTTLLDRKDHHVHGLRPGGRVPFCDHHLVGIRLEHPWSMKAMNGRRKQVLRDAAEGCCPRTCAHGPSPLSQDPQSLYEELVRARLAAILDDPAAPFTPW